MLSVTVTVAVRVPVAVGVKVTVIKQVPSGLTLPGFGQVLAGVIWKSPGSVPPSAMLEIFKAIVIPVSVSVEVLAALVVPTFTAPKLINAGTRVAVVSDPPAPVPVRLMVCGLPVALSLTFNVAERDPLAVGVNVTATKQVARGLIVPELGQVLAELI